MTLLHLLNLVLRLEMDQIADHAIPYYYYSGVQFIGDFEIAGHIAGESFDDGYIAADLSRCSLHVDVGEERCERGCGVFVTGCDADGFAIGCDFGGEECDDGRFSLA